MLDSEEKLCHPVEEFGQVCVRRKLKVNEVKNKIMKCSKDQKLMI